MFNVRVKLKDGRGVYGVGGETVADTMGRIGKALSSLGAGDSDVASITVKRSDDSGFKVSKPRAKKDDAKKSAKK